MTAIMEKTMAIGYMALMVLALMSLVGFAISISLEAL